LHVTFEQIPNLVHANAYLSVMIVRHLAFLWDLSARFYHKMCSGRISHNCSWATSSIKTVDGAKLGD